MKQHKKILSIFLAALLLLQPMTLPANASVSENNTQAPPEEPSISANDGSQETNLPGNDLDADVAKAGQPVTVTFYDSDNQTILMQFPFTYQGTAMHFSDFYETADFLQPVRKGYRLASWNCLTNGKTYRKASSVYNLSLNKDLVFTANWSDTPYSFEISYNTNGGSINDTDADGNEIDIPYSFRVTDDTITLPDATRKNFMFDGWYKDSTFTEKVTEIPAGSYIDSDENGIVNPLILYAKWKDARPKAPQLTRAQNKSTGKVILSYTATADNYEISYTTDKKFKKKVNKETIDGKTSCSVQNLPKGKTYYFRVRAFATDSTGSICYSSYSNVLSCKITKGVKEYKARKNAGKLKKTEIRDGQLFVSASVPKRLKSSDDSYYLVRVNPSTGKYEKKIAACPKLKKPQFSLPLIDEKGNHLIQGKYALAVKKGKSYFIISGSSFVKNPEAAATYTAAFPSTTSKKDCRAHLIQTLAYSTLF